MFGICGTTYLASKSAGQSMGSRAGPMRYPAWDIPRPASSHERHPASRKRYLGLSVTHLSSCPLGAETPEGHPASRGCYNIRAVLLQKLLEDIPIKSRVALCEDSGTV
eukprot:365391-Chlamydomonas_euryale.AAC.1